MLDPDRSGDVVGVVVFFVPGRVRRGHGGGDVGLVEVRFDGGPWQPAQLGPDGGNDYWRQWFFKWDATPGQHTIAARVTSGDGEVQSAVMANPFPEGASGIQEFLVTVA